jgi:hypothetical protein
MAVIPPPSVDALPPTPSSTAPTTFAALADAFFVALAPFRTQLIALVANAFSNATDAASSASSAVAAQSAAGASATNAATSAAQAASATNTPAFVSGQMYAQYAAALGLDFRVYRRRAAGASTVDPSADPTNWASPLPPVAPYIHVRETQPSGTASSIGTVGADTFFARLFNGSIGGVTIPGAGISGNGISLPAGMYEFEGEACFVAQGSGTPPTSKLALYNFTDAADIVIGLNTTAAVGANTNVSVRGRFTLTATKVIGLRQFFKASSGGGGLPMSNGQVEVYSSLKIEMIG